MQKRPYRAIVSDMDGTLLNEHHVIGDFTAQTLEHLYDNKVDIILATGRNYFDVSSILKKTKVKEAVLITSNGAQAHNLQGELLLNNALPEEIAYQVMNLPFDDNRVCVNSYQADGWFINKDIPELYKYHKDSGFLYEVVDFKQHHGRDTEKVFFIGKAPADLVELEQRLRQDFGERISLTYSTPICLEVMNKNVSKATALAQVIEQREYGLQDCIAFGDGMNDVEMLAEVGKGCMMGNADPRAMQVALAAWDCFTRVGAAEGERAIAQAIVYLAVAPKSNAVYLAFKAAKKLAMESADFDVPEHLRNAPTNLMKDLGFGAEYRYAHDEPHAYAAGENYFPSELKDAQFYFPTTRGMEIKMKEKLDWLKGLDQASQKKRYK